MKRLVGLAILVFLFAASAGRADVIIYKYDQFPADLASAAVEVGKIPLATQPGFAKGEAFGQLYKPLPGQYPVKILGIQMILAAPPNAKTLTANAEIEVWLDSGTGATPQKAAPDWKISTADLFNPATGKDNLPLVGNTALAIDFDWDNEQNHPPIVTEGNFRIVIRFTDPAKNLQSEWGTYQCQQMESLGMCGCQNVGLLLDQSSTPNVNLLHHISPLGKCSGGTAWDFMEKIGVTGDPILRVKAEVASGCTPNCAGKVCGDDGCGGSCGQCTAPATCKQGKCVEPCKPACEGYACGDDGCGGSCGTCPGDKECQDHQCVTPCKKACDGKECGPDGCEGICGECPSGKVCSAEGKCIDATCKPSCTDRKCGPDGCGGTCGACAADEKCDNGKCVPDADAVVVDAISPDFGFVDEDTRVSITGSGFKAGLTAKLGAQPLGIFGVTGDSLIDATVPKGLAPGKYLLVVVNPDGKTGSLMNAFEARERPVGCGDGTCGQGESCSTCPKDCGACKVSTGGGCEQAEGQGGWIAPIILLGLGLFLTVRRRPTR